MAAKNTTPDVSSGREDEVSYPETKTETESDSDSSEISTDDEDTSFNVRNVCNTADRDWTQVVDRENDIFGPENCLKFTPQYNLGPINCIDRNSAPHEYFLHLFGEQFLQDIIDETNRYGDAKKNMRGTNIGKVSHFNKWVHTNREESLAFLGIVINMGLVSKSSMKAYWNIKDWSQSTTSFPLGFTRDRFFTLQSVLHFPQLPGDNSKLRKVQGIVQHFSRQFQTYSIPKQHGSIDESLIGYEGLAPVIEYLPNKYHHRFGFKLFCLCESETGYIVNFTIY